MNNKLVPCFEFPLALEVIAALMLLIDSRKTRLHISQLVKDTSDKLKQASEIDHHAGVSVSSC